MEVYPLYLAGHACVEVRTLACVEVRVLGYLRMCGGACPRLPEHVWRCVS